MAPAAVGPPGVARLAALETLHVRQGEALHAVRQQLDKVHSRARVVSRDLRTTVRQVRWRYPPPVHAVMHQAIP